MRSVVYPGEARRIPIAIRAVSTEELDALYAKALGMDGGATSGIVEHLAASGMRFDCDLKHPTWSVDCRSERLEAASEGVRDRAGTLVSYAKPTLVAAGRRPATDMGLGDRFDDVIYDALVVCDDADDADAAVDAVAGAFERLCGVADDDGWVLTDDYARQHGPSSCGEAVA